MFDHALLGQCLALMSSAPAAMAGFFAMGLLGGATHCAPMCGPFVLAQIPKERACAMSCSKFQTLSGFALIPYHLGRMTTYIALAVLFSGILNLAFLFAPIKGLIAAPMLMLAGVLFLVSAFPSLSMLFPWAARVHLPVPFQKLSTLIGAVMTKDGAAHRYLLGVLLGFMPCGLLIAALMAASTLANPVQAALAMAAFAAGTVPSLFAVAACGHTVRALYPRQFAGFRRVFLALSAVWVFVLAGAMIF